jgi:hypothetical protein
VALLLGHVCLFKSSPFEIEHVCQSQRWTSDFKKPGRSCEEAHNRARSWYALTASKIITTARLRHRRCKYSEREIAVTDLGGERVRSPCIRERQEFLVESREAHLSKAEEGTTMLGSERRGHYSQQKMRNHDTHIKRRTHESAIESQKCSSAGRRTHRKAMWE